MMLFIRASLLSSYGKNIAKPRYDQKKDQFAKYCHTPLNIRIHLVFWWISSKRHFATLSLKFLLNPISKETMSNLQNTVKRRGIIVDQNTVRRLIILVLSLSYDAYHHCVTLKLLQ